MSYDANRELSEPHPSLKGLEERIESGDFTVGVYGLGYVGLPLALRFAQVGIEVIGFDIDPKKVELLNEGKTYIERITESQIQSAREAGFTATADFSLTNLVDAQIICVPTPLDKYHQPDLSFVVNTVESILPHFRSGQLMSLESTTWPGTTEERKRGDTYLRTLLIHGGRTVVRVANKHQDKRSAWVTQLEERRGKNISAVAVANKNARVAWALLSNKSTYQASAA